MGKHLLSSNDVRRIRRFVLPGIILLFVGLGLSATRTGHTLDDQSAQAADCQSGVGGRLFSNGGELEVEMLAADAGFTTELYLMSPGPQRLIATNRNAGTIVKLGSFQEGVELVFGAIVRETQRTFFMGSGSANPDGLPHAEVTCFGGGRSNVGFEDQFGGGDHDYNDLVCTVRQPKNSCTYSVNPKTQSFGSAGGEGSLAVAVQSSCSWSSKSNVNWISITSSGSGGDNGTVRYSVAANPEFTSRTGSVTVQGEALTVFQDAAGGQPIITSIWRKGSRKVFVIGLNFDGGSVILLNGEEQYTLYNSEDPSTVLLGKKVGKRVVAGDTLRVKNSFGVLSHEYIYVP